MRRRIAAVAALLLAGTGGAAVGRPAPDAGPSGTVRAAPAEPSGTGRVMAAEDRPARGIWPLAPAGVARGFDPPANPWEAGHRGVDLTGRIGAPVRAAMGGVVRHAAPIAGRGVVVVGHGATRTTYEPVAATVARGDRVAAGEVLGHLSMAGSHCLPATCLHWGWRRGETYLDPLALVGAARVRLKPADGPAGRPAAAGRW